MTYDLIICYMICKEANLDVVCIQEVRRLNEGSVSHLGYDFYWTGTKSKRIYGVGIAVRKCPEILIQSVIHSSCRIMAMDLSIRGFKIRIISVYAPTEDKPLSTKQSLYRELRKLFEVNKDRKIIIQGDFNATASICCKHTSFSGYGYNIPDYETANENGNIFIDFCKAHDLSILNTWFKHKDTHMYTWYSPDSRTRKVYDFSICGSWLREFIKDVRTKNSYFNSDHRLLVTKTNDTN